MLWQLRIGPRRPDKMCARYSDGVGKIALRQRLAKFHRIAISSVGEDQVFAHAPGQCVIDQPNGNLPLCLELEVVGDAGLSSPSYVLGPYFRKIQAHANTRRAGLARQVKTRRHLAIASAAERPRILAMNSH